MKGEQRAAGDSSRLSFRGAEAERRRARNDESTILQVVLLRCDLHLGSRGADVGVNMALERHEVVLEHGDEAAGGLVELRLVLPSLVRIEQMRFDAGELPAFLEAEIRIGAELGVAQRPV